MSGRSQRELAADVEYYEQRHSGRGQRFAAAVDALLGVISELPLAFPMLYEPDIRSAKVPRFPYRIVYLVVGGNIEVVAFAHAKRRPAYWRGRLT